MEEWGHAGRGEAKIWRKAIWRPGNLAESNLAIWQSGGSNLQSLLSSIFSFLNLLSSIFNLNLLVDLTFLIPPSWLWPVLALAFAVLALAFAVLALAFAVLALALADTPLTSPLKKNKKRILEMMCFNVFHFQVCLKHVIEQWLDILGSVGICFSLWYKFMHFS